MSRHQTPDTRHTEAGTSVRLRKPHACGGSEFTVIRNSVVVTLKCNTCGSFVRMPKDKYLKAVIGDR